MIGETTAGKYCRSARLNSGTHTSLNICTYVSDLIISVSSLALLNMLVTLYASQLERKNLRSQREVK